jgi:hypothetical protein
MPDNADVRLFEMVKQQDSTMHTLSGELGVKTSLYLVFAAFVLSASIQILNFAKDLHIYAARCAVFFCSLGAAIALCAGVALLGAALVRNYKIFPASEVADWLKKMKDYQTSYPQQAIDDPASGLLQTVIKTVEANQIVNEKKARWIEVGAWLLFASLPFFAVGGAFAVYAYFSHPF